MSDYRDDGNWTVDENLHAIIRESAACCSRVEFDLGELEPKFPTKLTALDECFESLRRYYWLCGCWNDREESERAGGVCRKLTTRSGGEGGRPYVELIHGDPVEWHLRLWTANRDQTQALRQDA